MNTNPNDIVTSGNDTAFVVTPDLEIAGAVSYWRLSGVTNLRTLDSAWRMQGLDGALLPEAPGAQTVCRRAIDTVTAKRRLVRPLSKSGAWVIVDETPRGEHLDWEEILRVVLVDNRPRFEVLTQAGAPLVAKIEDEFIANYEALSPLDMSAWLVKLAEKATATSLRDTGGIYFVPREHVDFWRKAVTAVQQCGSHRIYRIPAVRNEEAVEAILDAVVVEAETEMGKLQRELAVSGDEALGLRALRTREGDLGLLLAKVEAYEKLLDMKGINNNGTVHERLGLVRSTVERLQAQVTAATLAASLNDEAA